MELLAQPQRQQLDVAARKGENFLVRPIRNLRGLAELQADVKAALDGPDEQAQGVLRQFFYDLLVRNPDFAQMRWLGEDGHERVRVDVLANQLPFVTPSSALQDKHDRPYFAETLRLPAGTLYVSPLDLNVENGRIETPYRPMLRLAMHVFNDAKAARGVFVLNVDGSELLRQLTVGGAPAAPLQLLNAQGYWLKGERPEQEWGFMFGRQATLAAASPAAWTQIRTAAHGQVELQDGLWTWDTTEPVPRNASFPGELQWKVVSRIPEPLLASARSHARWNAAAGGSLVVIVAVAMSWALATLNERRRRADQQALAALERAVSRERERDELLQFLKVVTDSLPALVGYWNRDLRLCFANRAYAEWFSHTAESILEADRAELLDETTSTQTTSHADGALAGQEQQFERSFTRPDGTRRHTINRYIPDRDEQGVKGFIAVTVDVTELKDTQLRLQDLNAKLERETARAQSASQAKSEFLSNMSHEIRTPMNGILGLCYLMEQEALPAAALDMMQRIRGAGRALLSLINDILDFSKIEAGRLETERVPFRLSDVLDSLASVLSSSAERKPIEVIIGPPPADADFLVGDPLRLGQVLINLAGNAVKFTERGEVVVRVTRLDPAHEDHTPQRLRLRFSVRDTGIGIDASKLDAIFRPFSQADSSTTRQYGGTGLGLAISHRLVELMGGELRVNSTPGQGSEFHFDLDLATSHPSLAVSPELAHQRVLIADDQPTALEVLVETTASLGWHATGVKSGQEAIRTLQAARQQFDVVVLDWKMPDLDGLEVARQLRQPGQPGDIPAIVMVTAFDRDQLRAQAEPTLVDAILTKPVTPSSLFNAVREAKNRRATLPGMPVRRPPGRSLADLRILVADDNDLNREVAVRILEGEGAEVDTATNGAAALATLTARPGVFHVVLMDMQMPVMDGYEATRCIRSTPGLEDLRVVAITAGAFKMQRDQALAAGVDEFVSKPFDVPQLLGTILRLARGTPAPAVAARTYQNGRVAQILNVEIGGSIWRSREAYTRVLDQFTLQQLPVVQQMARAEPARLGAMAHRLRGAAGQLGIEVVAQLAGEIEDGLIAGMDVQERVAELAPAMEAAVLAIESYKAVRTLSNRREVPAPVHPAMLAARLHALISALDSDDIAPVERALAGLDSVVAAEACETLRRAVENFDFRTAETLARDLAARLGVTLES